MDQQEEIESRAEVISFKNAMLSDLPLKEIAVPQYQHQNQIQIKKTLQRTVNCGDLGDLGQRKGGKENGSPDKLRVSKRNCVDITTQQNGELLRGFDSLDYPLK